MKLRKVSLKNFRCFDEFEIEFSEKHNVHVLIAENMVGKSALLHGLRLATGSYLIEFGHAPGISLKDLRIIGTNPIADFSRSFEVRVNVDVNDLESTHVPTEIAIVSTPGTKKLMDEHVIIQWANSGIDSILQIARRMYDLVAEQKKGCLPLLLYTGADYLNLPISSNGVDHLLNGSIINGYNCCLDDRGKETFVFDWLTAMDDILEEQHYKSNAKALYGEIPSVTLDLFEAVLTRILPEIRKVQWVKGIKLRKSRDDGGAESNVGTQLRREKFISFEMADGTVKPIDMLSDGYRYLTLLVGELTVRSVMLNKHLGKGVNELINGVVLIDEFGIHLHPELQNKALHRLSTAFPNVQFIVTTHSPMLLNGLKKEQVHILEMDDAGKRTVRHPNRDIVGMGAEGILMEVFGLETTFDDETVRHVRELQALSQKRLAEGLNHQEKEEFAQLMDKVGLLGYDTSLQDPLYRGFLVKYREIMKKKGAGSMVNEEIDDVAVEKAILDLLAEESLEA